MGGEEMSGIEMKNGLIVYYGNPAGYFKENKAIVDTMFQSKEFEDWIAEKKAVPEWTDGIFERLSKGEKVAELLEDKMLLKHVRIWQLKTDSDFELRFRGYDEVVKSTGEPSKDNYNVVFDGELETNNLESIYTKFNMDYPINKEGSQTLHYSKHKM